MLGNGTTLLLKPAGSWPEIRKIDSAGEHLERLFSFIFSNDARAPLSTSMQRDLKNTNDEQQANGSHLSQ